MPIEQPEKPQSARTLLDQISDAISNLIHLRITTAIGPITVTFKSDGSAGTISASNNLKAISTNIDLLQGDITTVFDPDFVNGPYQNVRDFHAAREKEGQEIIKKNIEAATALIKLVKDYFPNKKASTG